MRLVDRESGRLSNILGCKDINRLFCKFSVCRLASSSNTPAGKEDNWLLCKFSVCRSVRPSKSPARREVSRRSPEPLKDREAMLLSWARLVTWLARVMLGNWFRMAAATCIVRPWRTEPEETANVGNETGTSVCKLLKLINGSNKSDDTCKSGFSSMSSLCSLTNLLNIPAGKDVNLKIKDLMRRLCKLTRPSKSLA